MQREGFRIGFNALIKDFERRRRRSAFPGGFCTFNDLAVREALRTFGVYDGSGTQLEQHEQGYGVSGESRHDDLIIT